MTLKGPKGSQFQGLRNLLDTSGGFSMRVAAPGVGRIAKDSYMVGLSGLGRDGLDTPVSNQEIQTFIEDRADDLSAPGRHMGGWVSPTGKTALDVSQAHPRTPEGESAARAEALRGHQEAYGEVGHSGEYVGDHPNPFHMAGHGDAHANPVGSIILRGAQQWVEGTTGAR